jgi:hypothetical protein
MYADLLQLRTETVQITREPQDRERAARRLGVLTELSLRDESVLFERTIEPIWVRTRASARPETAPDTLH